MHQWIRSALVHIMAWHRISNEPLSEPVLDYCQLHGSLGIFFSEVLVKTQNISFKKMHLTKMLSAKWWPFFSRGDELNNQDLFSFCFILPHCYTKRHTNLDAKGPWLHASVYHMFCEWEIVSVSQSCYISYNLSPSLWKIKYTLKPLM